MTNQHRAIRTVQVAIIFLLGVIFARVTTAQTLFSPEGPVIDPRQGAVIYPYEYQQPQQPQRSLPSRTYEDYYGRDRAYIYWHPDDGVPSEAPMIQLPRGSIGY